MTEKPKELKELEWLDPLKALALFGILLNHLVEVFGSGPWFTHPSNKWPDFDTRLHHLFPQDYSSTVVSFIQFLGWLGDNCPGVFILASAIGLTWSALHKPADETNFSSFFRRRVIRIFPLYIAMHLIILAGSLLVPGNTLSVASPKALLSMLGLRFTDSLFFYINPSWWFIWLILQLYLIFPILYHLLQRLGWKWFLTITLVFTFASRAYGLIFSDSLYYWMMGIFFGTRLAEFSAGMVIALLLSQLKEREQKQSREAQLWGLAIFVYLLGFACSLTWVGSVVSNLFITLGLSGIFYGIWRFLLSKAPLLRGIVIWIGIESYGVYLLHQPPLKWTAAFLQGEWRLLAAILLLIASFPAAWFISRFINNFMKTINTLEAGRFLRIFSVLVSIVAASAIFFIEPWLNSNLAFRAFYLMLTVCAFFVGLVEYICRSKRYFVENTLCWTALFAVFLQLFVLPSGYGKITFLLGLLIAFFSSVVFRSFNFRPLAWAVGFSGTLLICFLSELALRYYHPLEAGRWGELPALQAHPTRVYALKPNQETRLRYNNYDYVLKTNSLGLASPEIEVNRPTPNTLRILIIGDAFSMPEGVEYPQSYPALLEKYLNNQIPHRSVQVINAGVTGYGPVEQYPQLQELGPLFKPDIVIYQFFINEVKEAELSPKKRLQNIGLLSRDTSRRNNFLASSQLITHYKQFYRRLGEQIKGRPDEWRFGKALLSFYRAGDNELYSEQKLAMVKFYLEKMNGICQEINAKFIIYFVPGAVAVSKPDHISYFPWGQDLSDRTLYDLQSPLRHLLEINSELNIPVVDLTPYLKKHPIQPVYFPDSWHWNSRGHDVVAKAMLETLIAHDYIAGRKN